MPINAQTCRLYVCDILCNIWTYNRDIFCIFFSTYIYNGYVYGDHHREMSSVNNDSLSYLILKSKNKNRVIIAIKKWL